MADDTEAETEAGGRIRAAIDALKDQAREARAGIRKSGRKFRANAVGLAWAIGLAMVATATLLATILLSIAAVYFVLRDAGATRGVAMLACVAVGAVLTAAAWFVGRRLIR